MLECEWERLRKQDPELKAFITDRQRPCDRHSTMSEDSILTGRHGREAVWWLVLWKSIFTSRMIWSPNLLRWPRSLKHRRIQRHWWPHESLCSRKGDHKPEKNMFDWKYVWWWWLFHLCWSGMWNMAWKWPRSIKWLNIHHLPASRNSGTISAKLDVPEMSIQRRS